MTAATLSVRADRALDALEYALGIDAVQRGGEGFADPYRAPGDVRGPAGVVFPASTEQVRTVLQIARASDVAVWPHSQGRNFGYGGAEPRLAGSIALSLRRMDRILDIDDEHGVAVIEPGVTFFQLHEALRSGGHRFVLSVPDLGWGSVLGNALEHGLGYTAGGEHADQLCGMEVVLPSGDVLRTGTGGMAGSDLFHVHRRGFGPSLDGLFTQSNMGVVTRAGVWLAPEPECFLAGQVGADHEADLAPLVETLRPLLQDGTITGLPLIGHAFGAVASLVPRESWPALTGPGTEDELAPVLAQLGLPLWGMRFGLAGRRGVVAAQRAAVEEAFGALPGVRVGFSEHGPPYTDATLPPQALVPAGVPTMGLLRLLDAWGGHGGTAGHRDLSPVTPFTGRAAEATFRLVHGRLRREGIAAASAVITRRRSLIHVNMLMFDRTDPVAVDTVDRTYRDLADELGAAGHGLYRTHIDNADVVAARYGFGDHALHRTLRTLKDALDPTGVLAPGKQGVWPSARPSPDPSTPS